MMTSARIKQQEEALESEKNLLTLDFVIEFVASLTTAKFPFPMTMMRVGHVILNCVLIRDDARDNLPIVFSNS